MATTKIADLINPEIMADMISAKLPAAIKFAPLAEIDTTLQNRPGDTITVPYYEYIGDAVDVAEGEEIVPTKLVTDKKQKKVKKVAKAVELTDEAVLSGFGDPIGNAEKQLLQSVAAKVDNDCLTELLTTKNIYTGTSKLTAAGIIEAVDKFGEEDYAPKVMFIHPLQHGQLLKDMTNYQAISAGEALVEGVVAKFAGVQIVVSNKVKLNDGGTDYENVIVKPGALKIELKRDYELELERKGSFKKTILIGDEHYVAWLYDESKCVKATFKK